MNIIFYSKHIKKNNCLGIDALKFLIKNTNINITCIVKDKDLLYNFCVTNNISVYHNINLIDTTPIDLIVSYGWGSLIPSNILKQSRLGGVNFHPAPLPDWRGMGGVFNYALYENITEWGCSAHFIDTQFDTGDIIKTNKFSIQNINSVYSLTKLSHNKLLLLFKEIMPLFIENRSIPRIKQSTGRYISKVDLDRLREVHTTDSAAEINKKIESCFCPPHHGAYITINGIQYSIINSEILNRIKLE